MTTAESLLTLQDIDSAIDHTTRRLTEIKAALHETDELITVRSAVRRAEDDVVRKRATRKDLDLADASLETRIKQAEQRLYSGTVRNPKELLDLQNDISSLKKQKNTLDDQLFTAMVGLEEAETELQKCSDAFTRVEAEWRASQGDLITELAQLEQALSTKTAEQTDVRAELRAADLTLYDQLRRRKGGLAVAEMTGNNCGACHVRVTAHVLQLLNQADHLARCSNCERILVRI
jgi:predicted  nucleic acid-binding Zn-ribbon protein